MIWNYTVATQIAGVLILSALLFYALRLLESFKTGMIAKSWKQMTAGAIFLILAQFVFLANDAGFLGEPSILVTLGTVLRFCGVVFIIIGLRSQSRVWRGQVENFKTSNRTAEPIEA